MNIKYFIVYMLDGSRHFVAGPDFDAAMRATRNLWIKDVSDYQEINPAQFPQLDFARLETLSEEARQQWLARISSSVQGGLNAKRDEEPADAPFYERTSHPTGAEQCTVRVTAMEPIPAGANPFHHDDWSMGTDIANGWTAMFSGSGETLNSMYLVNTRSGQRIKLNFDYEGFKSETGITEQLVDEGISREMLEAVGKLEARRTPEAAPTTPYPEPKLIQANWAPDPADLGMAKRRDEVLPSLRVYEWYEYQGRAREWIHKSGPTLDVKHGTVFGVRVEGGVAQEELVFPALGTALAFNMSKNSIAYWKDRASPLQDTQFVKDKRCLGFWNNERGQYPQFPMPKPTDMRPSLRKAIVDALADVQASPLLQVVNYRGYSSCRICGNQQVNRELDYQMGSREYSIAPEYGKAHGWMWPEGLSHYVHEHGINLPEAFLIEVLGIGRHRLAALGYYDLIELAPGVRVVTDGQIKTGFKELDAIMPQGFQRGEFIMHSVKPSSDSTYPDLGTANKYAQSDNGDQS